MKDILKETAKELNLPYDVVEKVIKSFMQYIKIKISKIKYNELEKLDKVKTNFFIPYLGKLVVKSKTKRKMYGKRIKEITN